MIILPKTYRQTNAKSCGPSCLLMAINYLDAGRIKLTEVQEKQLHKEIGHKNLQMYTMPGSMCEYLLKMGFEVNYFFYDNPVEHDTLIDACFGEDQKIRNKIAANPAFHFHFGNFAPDVIKSELIQDRPGFVPINVGTESKPLLHWLLLLNYVDNPNVPIYILADPWDGRIKAYVQDDLSNQMYLTGRVFISAWKPV